MKNIKEGNHHVPTTPVPTEIPGNREPIQPIRPKA